MKKIYKYLAVVLCALVGAGSAAAENPDKLYLYSSNGAPSGDWSPYYVTFADNENGVYHFNGVPLVEDEYFLFASGTMNGWTVNNYGKRYEPVRDNTHQVVTFEVNDASSFDEGYNHCWKVKTTGIYNIEINFQAKNIAFNRSEDSNQSYRLRGTILDGSSWNDLIMTHNTDENVWEYKGAIKSGDFGVKKCTNGEQSEWIGGGNVNITEVNKAYDFVSGDNSKTSLSGDFIVKYDPTNQKITFASLSTVTITGDYNLAYSGSKSKVHYWGVSSSDWPGVEMVTVTGSDGNTYKCYKVPSGTTGIIFNNGGDDSKTSNLSYTDSYVMNDSGATSTAVVFKTDDDPDPVTAFTINGTTAPQICGAYIGISNFWTDKVEFTKVSDTEYTYSFKAAQETAYFGLYDSTGAKFVPGNLALTDGEASTTSFTASDKDFVGGDSSNECKISGLSVNTEYVMTLKKDGDTVTLSIKAGESGDDPTPGPDPVTTVVTSEMIAGMIPTLPGAEYQIFGFEKTNNSDGKAKVLNAKGYDGMGAATPANYYWVKYEDEAVYYDGGVLNAKKYAASDNPRREDIAEDDNSTWKLEDSTDKNYHDCRNFSEAYYRVYMQNTVVPDGYTVWEGRPSASATAVLSEGFEVATAERTAIVNPHYGKDKLNVAQRVARTIFVGNNTTGIEDVITPETFDDADAPVVFYNLQGMRVENPSNGIYIRVQGKTTTKVYIK